MYWPCTAQFAVIITGRVIQVGGTVIELHPKGIKGSWDQGYVLDVRTISSTMIGYNEFGHPEFDTVRSQIGELEYRLKYEVDKAAVSAMLATAVNFVNNWAIHPDAVIPMPPSKLQRSFQPAVEIATEVAKGLNVPVNTTSLKKTNVTSQMKDLGDFSARVAALSAVFTSDKELKGKEVLLVEDLFQSGASMNVAARTLKGKV
jgi:predicted amidophosphoribosyltransferase